MVIEINKDIDRYQESVAMGLTAKQLILSIASVVMGGGLVYLLYPFIGLTGAAYVAIPVVAPIALGGFYSYNGMSFYEVMGKKFHYMFGNRALTYVSTEGDPAIKAYELEQANALRAKGKGKMIGASDKADVSVSDEIDTDKKKNSQAEFEASKKKMMRMLIICMIFIVLLVGVAVAYKLGYLAPLISYVNSFRVLAGKEQVDYSKKEYAQSNVAVIRKPWEWQKKVYQNLELHLDAAIDKVDNLAKDVEIQKMEKKWDELYEQTHQESIVDAIQPQHVALVSEPEYEYGAEAFEAYMKGTVAEIKTDARTSSDSKFEQVR